MNLQQVIEREAAEYPSPLAEQAFISGANFALGLLLKELDKSRHEQISINGLRSEVVNWPDIEKLLGKIDTGF